MANGASRIFKVMQNSGTDTVSELVHLKVKTINPLTFTLDDRVTLTEDFVELNSNINKSNLKIDDVLTAFSLNGGQLFFIQQYFSENSISKELPAGGNQGQILSKKSNEDYDAQWIDNNGGITGDTLPIGAVIEFPSDNIPDNWLLCNGQAVSRTDYAELFAAIGTTWGAGNGSTTFNVPTKEGLVTVGKKTSDSDFNTLGKTGGKKTHTHTQGQTGSTTLTIAQIPSHIHSSLYHKNADNPLGLNGGSNDGYTLGWSNGTFSANGDLITSSTGGGQGHTHTNPTTNSSSSIQPYTTSNFIIKAKQNAGVVATVVDNLNSDSTTDALSAKQGKELNQKIDAKIVTNTEIATNEYVNGKRVYIKQIEFTDVLNAGQSITKPLNLPQASRIWIDTANSYFINLTGGRTVPIPCTCYEGNFSDRVGIQISYGAVVLYADTGWNEAWTKVIRLKYIK